jgi:hypothetical protein
MLRPTSHLFFGLHGHQVPLVGQVALEVIERLEFVFFEAVALFVAQRALLQVDGVLDVVRTLAVLPRPVVGDLGNRIDY